MHMVKYIWKLLRGGRTHQVRRDRKCKETNDTGGDNVKNTKGNNSMKSSNLDRSVICTFITLAQWQQANQALCSLFWAQKTSEGKYPRYQLSIFNILVQLVGSFSVISFSFLLLGMTSPFWNLVLMLYVHLSLTARVFCVFCVFNISLSLQR